MKAKHIVVAATLSLSLAFLSACSGGVKETPLSYRAQARVPGPALSEVVEDLRRIPSQRTSGLPVGWQRHGMKNFIDKTVDFAASDRAMTPDEMAKVNGGAQCVPMTAGAGVPGVQYPRRSWSEAFPRRLLRHLSWQGYEMERSHYCEGQSRSQATQCADQRCGSR